MQVMFKSLVSIADNPKINQWLTLVVQLNLATLLVKAVDDVQQFNMQAVHQPD